VTEMKRLTARPTWWAVVVSWVRRYLWRYLFVVQRYNKPPSTAPTRRSDPAPNRRSGFASKKRQRLARPKEPTAPASRLRGRGGLFRSIALGPVSIVCCGPHSWFVVCLRGHGITPTVCRAGRSGSRCPNSVLRCAASQRTLRQRSTALDPPRMPQTVSQTFHGTFHGRVSVSIWHPVTSTEGE
jgi:hypothetical protein